MLITSNARVTTLLFTTVTIPSPHNKWSNDGSESGDDAGYCTKHIEDILLLEAGPEIAFSSSV